MTRFTPFLAAAAAVALLTLGGAASAAPAGGGPGPGPGAGPSGHGSNPVQVHGSSCASRADDNGLVGPARQTFIARCLQDIAF